MDKKNKMNNDFFSELNNEELFYSLIEDIESCKVGFYSVGLYPASLASVSYTHLTLPTNREV